ncbi:MAG: iron-containing alcohol dehydrogenase [Eubacterium sp.]|nr:iron-containing alcohol dehydrogenase [Eubacterium sp.]
MPIFSFSIPQTVIFGSGSLAKLPECSAKLSAKKAMILTGPHLAKMPVMAETKKKLEGAGIGVDIFSDIEGNPSTDTVAKATEAFKESGADILIAFGGGSPMDVAKAVAVVATYGGNITEYEGGGKVPGKVTPIIAIPTTAGTGSEVTAFSVITDHKRNYKLSVFSYDLVPAYAILDPELLVTTPAHVAAACGIDAFIHAEESYISKAASPFTEMMSEKAMELIGGNIRAFVADRMNVKAAEAMLQGSLYAGIAFSWARLGDVHAMSHPVSAWFNVPHGVANGILLPVVVDFNALADQGKYKKIAGWISPSGKIPDDFEPAMLGGMIRSLNKDIGIPACLSEAGVTDGHFDQMADDAMKSGNIAVNPRTTTKEDVLSLYKTAM